MAVADPPDRGRQHYDAQPVEIHSVELKDRGRDSRGVERRGTEPFSMLGISWPSAKAPLGGRAEVRTRSAVTGEWSDWTELDTHLVGVESEEGAEQTARGSTEPLWAGPSDGVEARVVAEDGTVSSLPQWMRLDLIDPGVTVQEARQANRTGRTPPGRIESPAAGTLPAPEPTGGTSPSPSAGTRDGSSGSPSPTATPSPAATVPVAPESTVTRPPIVTRAQWGADESMVEEPSYYHEGVQAAFVHHTTGENGYSCAQSPAMVRSLMTFHIKSKGWNDLGYNFVVDKCGTLFEGRSGGIDLPVYGAHTYGFNGYSTGIAVLGSFHKADGHPNTRINRTVARIAAYKLGQYGGDPEGRVTLEAAGDTGVYVKGEMATLNTISGHRDGFDTECPGDRLYGMLDEIRHFAGSPAASSAAPTADVDRDGLADMLAGMPDARLGGHADAGMVSVLPGTAVGPSDEPLVIDQSSPGVPGANETGDRFGEDSAYGDIDGDGYADLVVGLPGEEHGDSPDDHGVASVLYGPGLNSGIALSVPAGERTEGARFGSGIEVADVDSDGHADVVIAAPGAPGRWYLFDGGTAQITQSGHLGGSAYTGDSQFTDLASGDFDRDGYLDVAVNHRDPSGTGRVLMLHGSAGGLEPGGLLATKGGRSVAAGDTDGDGYDDLVIGQPYVAESDARGGGQITVLRGSSGGLTSTGKRVLHQDSAGVGGGSEGGDSFGWSVSVGDVNNDMRADVLVGAPLENLTRDGDSRKDAGMVHLLYGSSDGVTGSGSLAFHQDSPGIPGATETGDRFGSAVQLADVSGWGRTDLGVGEAGEGSGNGGVVTIPAGSTGIHPDQSVFHGPGTFGAPADAEVGSSLTP